MHSLQLRKREKEGDVVIKRGATTALSRRMLRQGRFRQVEV
jgi:hypothetical protein